jgi:CBS-domain-containing membrane protein
LRKLKIGTYVSSNSPEGNTNPYHPIATATLKTPVFDVVHMFSERSISAVPIIDEDGVVVNLYETVDVIVCHLILSSSAVRLMDIGSDARAPGSVSEFGFDDFRSSQSTIA